MKDAQDSLKCSLSEALRVLTSAVQILDKIGHDCCRGRLDAAVLILATAEFEGIHETEFNDFCETVAGSRATVQKGRALLPNSVGNSSILPWLQRQETNT